jgi:hypothetical protein
MAKTSEFIYHDEIAAPRPHRDLKKFADAAVADKWLEAGNDDKSGGLATQFKNTYGLEVATRNHIVYVRLRAE